MSDDNSGQPFRDPPRPSTPESHRSIGPAFERLCNKAKEPNKPEEKTCSEPQSQCPPTPTTPISPPTDQQVDCDSDSGDFCCYARPLVFNDCYQEKSTSTSNSNQSQNQNPNQGTEICPDDENKDSKSQGNSNGSKTNECEGGESFASFSCACPNCGFGGTGRTIPSFPEPNLEKCQVIKIDWNPSLKKAAECEEVKPQAQAEQGVCDEPPLQKPPLCESEDDKERGKVSQEKKEDGCSTTNDIFSRNNRRPAKPAPELCEKFRNFANGVPVPDPTPSLYDNRRDEVYNCIMCSQSDREAGKCGNGGEEEGEDENAAEIRRRINSMTSICPLSDNTKSDTFEAPGEGFRCPPMPNNVPLLIAPVYLQKPNEITVPAYPPPPGVKIQPMIKGIRTNRERNPYCFTCGAKRKPIQKKCFNKNCPAIKTAQPCPKSIELPSSIKGIVGEFSKTLQNLTGFKW